MQDPDYVLIGLYHKYGRKPFLDYFDDLKKNFLKKERIFYMKNIKN